MLLVLSHPAARHESAFLEWYQGVYRQTVREQRGVLSGQHYERHEVDITQGRWPAPPFRYLALYALSLDGAESAGDLIDRITALHREHPAAQLPATWLYYPVSEKVGRTPASLPCLLTIAFANGLLGQEEEFREWYATRHIRHALILPELKSGQCFARTHFQKPGALQAAYDIVAIYEQEGTPQALMQSLASVPEGALPFPMLDTARFGESVYRPM